MRKKLKLRDCDLACVVTVPSAEVGSDVYSRHLHQIRSVEGLIYILLEEHINFRVGYFAPDDVSLCSFESDDSCFVYGLVFDMDFLDSHPRWSS